MNHLNILYGVNNSFAQHAAVSIQSLIANNRNLQLNIVIAALNLSADTAARFHLLQTPWASIKVVDFEPSKLATLPEVPPYPKDIYLRLWVHEFFDAAGGNVLYIDADTVVVGSVMELAQLDLGSNILAAVDIPGAQSHKHCHLPTEYSYFNSGVLLINNRVWHDENCLQTVADFLNENTHILHDADQDALNGCFHKRRMTLDYKWNLISPFYRKNGFSGVLSHADVAAARADERIIHFNGHAKPWFYGPNHPRAHRYWEYLLQTPWRDYRYPDKTPLSQLKKMVALALDRDSFIK
jgi:lipopolysaccharide biosynthesis glycosyltransferase